ncbi:SPOR domain-containing protein [Sphingomonas glaciei]|uniref:SPOR domain-containing protein n=1 Tax=Sphingomonas glaciei TaxID=2938948 RepID=A0ABY5MWM7_9SPHN|nr:SPOR domain-containing protein [Sphingomonas glaciei]UUR08860.1 SPOR domain-containing protein [Sphingomonas glaciei]
MRRISLMTAALVAAAPLQAQSVRAGIEAWGVGQPEKAVAIWRPLAAKGQADAAFNLGQAYKLGRGVPADLAEAQRFYEQAARAGHLEAQTSLGLLLFQNGNRTAALRWLKQAADSGEPRAMLVYGTALFNGDGVPEDRIRAYALVSRSAAQGLAPAKTTLSEMDRLISLEERRKGVALAQQLANAGASTPVSGKAPPAKVITAATGKAAPVVVGAPATGAFRIQLGAFRDGSSAQRLFATLLPRLGGARMTLVPSGTMTRLQAGPYPSRAAAAAACSALKPQPCFPVAAR